MPRKTRRPPPGARPAARERVAWPGYLMTALLAAALGAVLTYAVLRPALARKPIAAVSVAPALSPDAARVLGYWYEDHQNWPQAIALLTQAVAGGLDNPDIRTDLGVALFQSGQPQGALDQYAVAQRQNPHHENSLFNQGGAYERLGDAGRAAASYRAYLARFPHGQHAADARRLLAAVLARPVAARQ